MSCKLPDHPCYVKLLCVHNLNKSLVNSWSIVPLFDKTVDWSNCFQSVYKDCLINVQRAVASASFALHPLCPGLFETLTQVPDALDVSNWHPNRDPEGHSRRVTQVSTLYYRVMGQSQLAPYLQVLKHTLAVYGIHVSSSNIEMCIRVVREWNPWFSEEGSIDLENWRQVCCNVEKAWRQGEKNSYLLLVYLVCPLYSFSSHDRGSLY